MEEHSPQRPHWSFWLIVIAILIWYFGGIANYLFQALNPDALDSYPEGERAIIENRPFWATAAFAAAVFGGALGCVFLLLRKASAAYLLALSLLGVVLTTIHATVGVGRPLDVATLAPQLMSLGVAVFLLYYAKTAARKGWIT